MPFGANYDDPNKSDVLAASVGGAALPLRFMKWSALREALKSILRLLEA